MPSPTGGRRDWIEDAATVAIIAGAGAATFHGLRDLALAGHFPWWVAVTLPLLLDGAALATARPWRDRRLPAATRHHAGVIAVVLVCGSIGGNVANVLHLGDTVGARVLVALVPPLVLALIVHLRYLVRINREELAEAKTDHLAAEELLADSERQRAQAADNLARAGDLHRDAQTVRARADAEYLAAAESAAHSEHLLRQAETDKAKAERLAADTSNAATAAPARKPAAKRGRKPAATNPPPDMDDLVARAKPLVAKGLGRNLLARELGTTPHWARLAKEQIGAEQQPQHTVNGHAVTTGGGQ